MDLQVRQEGEFQYIDEGHGEVLLLLHGLFGALSNWEGVVSRFSKNFRVVIPMLPIYEMPIKEAGLDVRVLTAEEKAAFREKMYPATRAAYLERAGEEGAKLIEIYEAEYKPSK